jgi:hypothetical protein
MDTLELVLASVLDGETRACGEVLDCLGREHLGRAGPVPQAFCMSLELAAR